MFIFEREGVRAGEGQIEGGQRSRGELWAVSPEPDAGFKPMNWEIMT